jgi:hypothetical protein
MVCRLWICRCLGGLCPRAESALGHIRANPKKLLEGEAIALLIEFQAEKILKDERLAADEYAVLYFAFYKHGQWGSAHEEKDTGSDQDATAADVPNCLRSMSNYQCKSNT